MLEKQLDFFGKPEEEDSKIDYFVPRRTQLPDTRRMRFNWLSEFYDRNGIPRPKGMGSADRKKMYALFYGTLKSYHVSVDDIVSR